MARGRTIEQRLAIHAPPEKVFAALTEPTLLSKWWTDEAEIDPRRGGRYRFAWDGGYEHSGDVLVATPPRLLQLGWRRGRVRTTVTFQIRRARRGALVTLREAGIPAGPRRFEELLGLSIGWMYYLGNLRAVLETGSDLRRPLDKYW